MTLPAHCESRILEHKQRTRKPAEPFGMCDECPLLTAVPDRLAVVGWGGRCGGRAVAVTVGAGATVAATVAGRTVRGRTGRAGHGCDHTVRDGSTGGQIVRDVVAHAAGDAIVRSDTVRNTTEHSSTVAGCVQLLRHLPYATGKHIRSPVFCLCTGIANK